MSKSKLGPEAKIITLFTALSDDSKRIVLDVIKSQSATPRKAAAKKPATAAPALKEPQADKEARCGVCYEIEDHPSHDLTYSSAHKFDHPKPVARAPRKSRQKAEVIPVSEQADNGLAAEMES